MVGVCKGCGKFAPAPKGFDERRHFMVCGDCQPEQFMCLDRSTTREMDRLYYKRCEKPAKFVSQDRS